MSATGLSKRVLDLLTEEGAMDRYSIGEHLSDVPFSAVHAMIQSMRSQTPRREKLLYVAAWVRNERDPRNRWMGLYLPGAKKDKPKPAPFTDIEKKARAKVKIRPNVSTSSIFRLGESNVG